MLTRFSIPDDPIVPSAIYCDHLPGYGETCSGFTKTNIMLSYLRKHTGTDESGGCLTSSSYYICYLDYRGRVILVDGEYHWGCGLTNYPIRGWSLPKVLRWLGHRRATQIIIKSSSSRSSCLLFSIGTLPQQPSKIEHKSCYCAKTNISNS